MAYKLKRGVYLIRCRESSCPFNLRFEIHQNIMGMTEKDVEIEAKRIAKSMAVIKHDAIYGNKHKLKASDVASLSVRCERIGSI